jgi:hypothetical protein
VISTNTGETKVFTLVAPSRLSVEKRFDAVFERPAPMLVAPPQPVVVERPAAVLNVVSNALALIYLDDAPLGPAPLSISAVVGGYHILKAVNERTGEVLVKPVSLPDSSRFERTVDFVFPTWVVRLAPMPHSRHPTWIVAPRHHTSYRHYSPPSRYGHDRHYSSRSRHH